MPPWPRIPSMRWSANVSPGRSSVVRARVCSPCMRANLRPLSCPRKRLVRELHAGLEQRVAPHALILVAQPPEPDAEPGATGQLQPARHRLGVREPDVVGLAVGAR